MTIIIVSRMIPLRLKTRISYWDLCIVSQLQGSRYPNPNFRGRGRGYRGSFRGQSNPRNNFQGQYQK
jgi:hypothetical protein